jgi:hypothetical protein
MRKISALLGLVALAFIGLPAGQAAAAPDTNCNGSIGAVTIQGKLIVPDGATCTLSSTRILGSVEVRINSTLRASRINVAGDLLGNQSRLVQVTTSSHIEGHTNIAKGVTVTLQSSNAFGGVNVTENRGRVTMTSVIVGNGGTFIEKNIAGVTAHSNRVNGNMEVSENRAGTSVRSNIVGDNLAVHKNLNGTQIYSNRANDNIDCVDNVPAPIGSGNVAGADGGGSKTGQCAGL